MSSKVRIHMWAGLCLPDCSLSSRLCYARLTRTLTSRKNNDNYYGAEARAWTGGSGGACCPASASTDSSSGAAAAATPWPQGRFVGPGTRARARAPRRRCALESSPHTRPIAPSLLRAGRKGQRGGRGGGGASHSGRRLTARKQSCEGGGPSCRGDGLVAAPLPPCPCGSVPSTPPPPLPPPPEARRWTGPASASTDSSSGASAAAVASAALAARAAAAATTVA